MSRSADFACMDCKVTFFLGKPIRREDDSVNYFHIGGEGLPPNWQRPELNQVIWKMLADHAGHNLRVVMTGDSEFELLGDFVMIGGHLVGDISIEDYLKDWDGIWE